MGRKAGFSVDTPNLSASVSCMDLGHIADEIEYVEASPVRFWHYDIVDGKFNRCLILGDQLYGYLAAHSDLPIELHIAAYDPLRYVELFSRFRLDYVAVHAEAMDEPNHVFEKIREFGAEPVLAYRAETPPGADFEALASQCAWILKLTVNPGFSGQTMQESALKHIRMMRKRLKAAHLTQPIQADGSVNLKMIRKMHEAGANLFTGGTSGLFRQGKTVRENAEALLCAAE